MIEIQIHNTHSKIIAAPALLHAASEVLSYAMPGAEFAKIPGWDGRIRLLKKDGSYPTGLTLMLLKWCKTEGLEFKTTDLREIPKPEFGFKINLGDKTPRYYQDDAAVVSDTKARGVFKIGTGGGKTVTSALIVDRKKVATLFVTPDTGLRRQAFADYADWFGHANVGTDIREDKPIIISNIQALAQIIKKKDFKAFARFKQLMIDEFHHAAASTYLDVNKACVNAYYRYGFTGTFIRTDGSDMTMHGVLSNVIFAKTTSELIEEGFLVRPYITIHELQLPKTQMNYKDAYDFITEFVPFNKKVAEVANEKIKEGKQTLVLVRRKEHGRNLESMIPGAVFVSGSNKGKDREDIKRMFIEKRIRCLVATEIFGEGQDIPSIDVLVNARAQKTEIQTSQGIGRALRKSEGKDKAEVFDFLFVGQKHLASHSAQRIMSYKKESAFVLQIKREETLTKKT